MKSRRESLRKAGLKPHTSGSHGSNTSTAPDGNKSNGSRSPLGHISGNTAAHNARTGAFGGYGSATGGSDNTGGQDAQFGSATGGSCGNTRYGSGTGSSNNNGNPDTGCGNGTGTNGNQVDDDAATIADPHPLYGSLRVASGEIGQPRFDPKAFNRLDLTLHSLAPDDIAAFYHGLKNSLPLTGMLLRSYEDIRPGRSLCQPQVSLARHDTMSMALYNYLAKPGVLPNDSSDAIGLIQQHSHRSDGFHLLYQLMRRAHPMLQPNHSSARPKWDDTGNLYLHAAHWQRYFENKRAQGRHYSDYEQSSLYLTSIGTTDLTETQGIRQLLDQIRESRKQTTLLLDATQNVQDIYTMMNTARLGCTRTISVGRCYHCD